MLSVSGTTDLRDRQTSGEVEGETSFTCTGDNEMQRRQRASKSGLLARSREIVPFNWFIERPEDWSKTMLGNFPGPVATMARG